MTSPKSSIAGRYPSASAAWMALALLLLAYTCSFVDRQVLSLLVQPIKLEFGISDSQMALLHGLSFGLFYSVLGVPFGLVADRWNRRNLIVFAIVGWSIATALCGVAGTYWQLFAARMAVGVGEACLSPAAYSLIADSFPPERRGRAVSIYASGAYSGVGVAFALGAAAVLFAPDASAWLASIGIERLPWQSVFIIASLAGLVIAPMLFLIREPGRQEKSAGQASLGDAFRFYRSRASFFVPFVVGLAGITIVNYAFFAWTPTIFQRSYGWHVEEIGTIFGIMLALLGPAGSILSGVIVDKLKSAPSDVTATRLMVWSSLLAAPCAAGAGLSSSPFGALLGLAGIIVFISVPSAMGPFLIQSTVANQFRGVSIALYFLILNLTGLALGPYLAAVISESIWHDPQRIGQAVAVLGIVCLPLAALLLMIAKRALRTGEPAMVSAVATGGNHQ